MDIYVSSPEYDRSFEEKKNLEEKMYFNTKNQLFDYLEHYFNNKRMDNEIGIMKNTNSF